LILLLPRVTPAERRRIETVLEDRSFARVSPQEILDLVQAEGTLEEVEEMAEDYAAQAKRELEIFPPSDARDALEFAPDFVLHRRS
jgi:geranylgeranyl pyrophosphate synthase